MDAIVCMLATGAKPMPTAKKRKCFKCKRNIWVSPTLLKEVERVPGSFVLLCRPCATEDITPETEVVITPETLKEAQEELRRRHGKYRDN